MSPYERGPRKVQRVAVDVAGRIPPNNEDAELAVLAAVLASPGAIDEVLAALPDGGSFYADAHRRIFDAAIALQAKGQPVDIATVAAHLKDRGQLTGVGGISYLTKIVDKTPSVAHVAAHAQIVAEKARVRALIDRCHVTLGEAFGDDYGDASELIDAHEQAVSDLAQTAKRRGGLMLVRAIVPSCLADLERTDDGRLPGYTSGLRAIDARTGGFHPGEVVVVAGRPGMGKTAYVLSITLALATAPTWQEKRDDEVVDVDGYLVAIFSLEMPKEQLAARIACARGKVAFGGVRRGGLSAKAREVYSAALFEIADLPIAIDDTASITVLEARSKLRRIQREHPRRKLIAIFDYLQLMRGGPGFGPNHREQEISTISRDLKALSKDLSIPVVAISQLNRAVESRADKRPTIADLRESGAIEQDADAIQLLYRPEYYTRQAGRPVPPAEEGLVEVNTAKQRNGEVGTDRVAFRAKSMRFEDPLPGDLARWPEVE